MINAYQNLSKRTMRGGSVNKNERLANYCMGLSGEAGEVTDIFKKHLFHGHKLDMEKVIAELGDALFYLAALATETGLTLEDVARYNVDKLEKRYPMGFSSEDSINRIENL